MLSKIYINKSKPFSKISAKFSEKNSAKRIKSCRAFGWAQRAPMISLPQELEKASEAGYFSSLIYSLLNNDPELQTF